MRRVDLPGIVARLFPDRPVRHTFVRVTSTPERSTSVAIRTTIQRSRLSATGAATATTHALRRERQPHPSHLANARVIGPQSCSCIRSPRAIAHWMLTNSQPAIEPTDLALDREEAAMWSSTLTGHVKIEHTAVDGACALRLGFTDGRSITIAMDELRVAATAAA